MADDRLDRHFAAAPGNAEIAAVWLRPSGVEVVRLDGSKELFAWHRIQRVEWLANAAVVHGEAFALTLNAGITLWRELAEAIEADLEAVETGRWPPYRALPEDPTVWPISRSQVRTWLGLAAGQSHRIRERYWDARYWLLAPLFSLLLLVAAGLMENTVPSGVAWLLAAGWLLHLVRCLQRSRPTTFVFDEDGMRETRGPHTLRSAGWSALRGCDDNRLEFFLSTGDRADWTVNLAPGPLTDGIVAAARRLLKANLTGAVFAPVVPAPPTALSRMGDEDPVPGDAGLSRTPGAGDA